MENYTNKEQSISPREIAAIFAPHISKGFVVSQATGIRWPLSGIVTRGSDLFVQSVSPGKLEALPLAFISLEVTPLEDITTESILYIADKMGANRADMNPQEVAEFKAQILGTFQPESNAEGPALQIVMLYDLLRELNYALPHGIHSVEKLVKEKVYRLKK